MPDWVKQFLDEWFAAAEITMGKLFRCVCRSGTVWGDGMTEKVVWHVVDAHLEGPEDPNEWTGTEINFEITQMEDGSEVRFSHLGLVPDFECFDACSSAWGFYVNGSLKRLITTGEGPAKPPWA